jgi:CheY-like chemotaxis protein
MVPSPRRTASRARSILVVEDDSAIADVVGAILEEEGYVVRVARDGAAGLAAVAESMPNLVTLDLLMPVMGGWEFLRALQSRCASVPRVVIVSAYGVDPSDAQALGADACLRKPFEIGALLEIISRLIAPPSR